MSLFYKITKSRNDWKPGIDPLWKLKVSDAEYEELKEFLHNNIINTFHPYCEREATLYFAEWWKREYSGGHHKKIDVANTISLGAYCDELFQLAVKGAESLRIKFIRLENTRYLDTLFVQGGLPLRALAQNDGVNRYEFYLSYIVKYVSTHYLNDWENIDFIQGFNNYISQSFQNEVMYDLTLSIVKAIYYDDDSFFPFNIDDDQFEKLVNNLRLTKSESRKILRENPFSIDWLLKKQLNELFLNYKVDCQSILTERWVSSNLRNNGDPFSRLILTIENHDSQKYVRKNNGDYSTSSTGRKIIGSVRGSGSAIINSQINTNTNQIFDISIPNSDIPDFQYPLLATKIDGNENHSSWKIVNNPIKGNLNALACPIEWNCKNCVGESLKINETVIKWYEFDNEIEISNGHEILKYDSNYSLDYKVDFGLQLIEWIQTSNYIVINRNPQIRVSDFDDNRLNSRKYNVFFKLNKESEWNEYNPNDEMPIGLIDFKVVIENRVTIRKSFFYCGLLEFEIRNSSISTGNILLDWNSGTVIPLNIQDGLIVEEADSNSWKVTYDDELKSYPETICFELRSFNDNSKKLRINVSTPFKGVVLLDPAGESVMNGQVLCANALLGYRCLVMGYENVPVTIRYFKNELDYHPAEVSTKFYKGLNNKLQMLENDIATIFRTNSKSFLEYTENGIFYLQIGQNLQFQLDHFNCILDFEDDIIDIKDKLGISISDFQYELFYAPLNCSPDNIRAKKIPKYEGIFQLNKDEIIGHEVIVFSSSRKDAHLQIRPRYINLQGIKRELGHDEIINSIKDELLENSFDNHMWKVALKYFEVAIEGNIPFETFNHLTSISKDKKLMSRFFIYLSTNYQFDEAILMNELARFESEFGEAWHWINCKVWIDAIDNYLTQFDDDIKFKGEIKKQLLKRVISLISFRAIDKESITKFFNSVFLSHSVPYFGYVPQPSRQEIQFEKMKFNNGNGIYIPQYVSDLFPKIPEQFRGLFDVDGGNLKMWGGLLLSPLFAALAFTGQKEVFEKNNYWHFQRVLYYLELDPEWYFYVFETMVKKIIQQN